MHDPCSLRVFISKVRGKDGVSRCLGTSQMIYFQWLLSFPVLPFHFPRYSLFFCVAHLCSCTPVTTVFREGGLSVLLLLVVTKGGFRKILLNKILINWYKCGEHLHFLLLQHT